MKIFISWSGEVSHAVALALKAWLPNVIQALEPFVSSEDIAKGGRWLARINAELEGAQFGVICLTPQNLESRWVLFEAGAIAVRFPEGRVAPLLIGLERSQVLPPLSQFQFTEPARGDMLKLVTDINACLGDRRLPPDRLHRAFDLNWPDLDTVLTEQSGKAAAPPAMGLKLPPKRDPDSMLAEILDLVRSMQRRIESEESSLNEAAVRRRKNIGIIAQAMLDNADARKELTGALGPLHGIFADGDVKGVLDPDSDGRPT